MDYDASSLTPSRAGITALLRVLGFDSPLRRVRRPGYAVRAAFRAAGDGFHAWLLELRAPFTPADVRDLLDAVHAADTLAHHMLVLAEPGYARIAIACDALRDGARHAVLEPGCIRGSDADLLREMVPAPGDGATARALRIMRALDRTRVSDRFFRDVAAVRDALAHAWTGIPRTAAADRSALALLLLSRMLFLYFLQRRGLLAGDGAYLPGLLREWLHRDRRRTTFYRARLRPLFFGALNRRPAQRTAAARALGELPYLNGGLFELHALERRCRRIDLPDDAVMLLFTDLLEKYRFTVADDGAALHESAIDPEMLGRIFEGLMPGEERSRTGSFYTPSAVVRRVVAETMHDHAPDDDGLRTLRVLDPACGSGAFLLGALAHVAELRVLRGIDDDDAAARAAVVAHTLHGVDLLDDAALICALRLWLSLVPQVHRVADVPPLPNLDRRIRQGDALVDPLDVAGTYGGRARSSTTPRELLPLIAALRPAELRYLAAEPAHRSALRAELHALELRVARAWLAALSNALGHEARELRARAADRDLFGSAPVYAAAAGRRLGNVEERRVALAALQGDVVRRRTLPFFSFRVHFADADGFDVVLSNPPWVRAHRWPPAARRLLRERYTVCADAGWPYAALGSHTPAAAGAQVDLSLLFLEQSLRLLRDGGSLGMLLPAKLLRSLYAGGARAMLLGTTRIACIEDHSLHQRAIFGADAFTAVIVARKVGIAEDPATPAPVRVLVTRADGAELRFELGADALPFRDGDRNAPWLLVPPDVRAAFRTMQARTPSISEHGLRIRRGVMTRANDVLLLRDHEAKLGDLSVIRADGWYRASERRAFAGHVETSCIRPVLRGSDIRAFHAAPSRHLLWAPCNDAAAAAAPPRLRRYLRRHRDALRQPDAELGTVYRVSADTFRDKVVWSDLAADLRAAAVPATLHVKGAHAAPLIPLNTVYFIPADVGRDAFILAAFMNSLPFRTLARAIAERAKDAHFRFFAWCISVLPLPHDWRTGTHADALYEASRRAHASGAADDDARTEMDSIVAAAYGLCTEELHAIARFDAWLRGEAVVLA